MNERQYKEGMKVTQEWMAMRIDWSAFDRRLRQLGITEEKRDELIETARDQAVRRRGGTH